MVVYDKERAAADERRDEGNGVCEVVGAHENNTCVVRLLAQQAGHSLVQTLSQHFTLKHCLTLTCSAVAAATACPPAASCTPQPRLAAAVAGPRPPAAAAVVAVVPAAVARGRLPHASAVSPAAMRSGVGTRLECTAALCVRVHVCRVVVCVGGGAAKARLQE